MTRGNGVFEIIGANFGTEQFSQIGATTEDLAKIVGKRADIGAGGTVNFNFKF